MRDEDFDVADGLVEVMPGHVEYNAGLDDSEWLRELAYRERRRKRLAMNQLARLRMAPYRAFEDEEAVPTDEEPEWFRELYEAAELRDMEEGR